MPGAWPEATLPTTPMVPRAAHTVSGALAAAPRWSQTRIGAGTSRATAVEAATASASCSPVWNRSAGSLARQRSTAWASLPGMPAATAVSGGAGFVMCIASRAGTSGASNGSRPDSA